MAKPRIPKLRRHSAGLAFVQLAGRRIYIGKHGSSEAEEKYHRLLAEWIAGEHQLPGESDITVTEVCARFWRYAQGYYKSKKSTIDKRAD